MSEAGLRAWIGEVERKLGKRTRVMLALAAIAIGGAGAAVFVAVEADSQAVSKGDLQALQRKLEERTAQGAGGSAAVTRLEAELRALKAEVEALKGGKKGAAGTPGATGPSGTTGPATTPPGTGTTGSAPRGQGTTGPTIGGILKKLQQSGSAKK